LIKILGQVSSMCWLTSFEWLNLTLTGKSSVFHLLP